MKRNQRSETLTCTAFEDYFWKEERAEYPMVISLVFTLSGRVDSDIFRAAVTATLKHNPLLTSTISPAGWFRPSAWVPVDEPVDLVVNSCDDDQLTTDIEARSLDLNRRSGASFELRQGQTRAVLCCWLHHACVDGIAALRLIADILAEYGNRVPDPIAERPTIRIPDPSVLKLRGVAAAPGNHRERIAPLWQKAVEAWRFLAGKTFAVTGHASPHRRPTDVKTVMQTKVLPRQTVRKLKSLAALNAASINDLCMMTYLQHLEQFSRLQADAGSGNVFRILMPVSMRTPEHDQSSAANIVSFVFHHYRRDQLSDPESLLRKIHHRTQQMLDRCEGATLLQGLQISRWLPFGYQLANLCKSVFATAALANVGDLKRVFENRFPLKKGKVVAGNLVVEGIDGIAPLRQNTNLVISFGSYAGELRMNLRHNPAKITDAEAMSFFDELVEKLESMADRQCLVLSEQAVSGSAAVKRNSRSAMVTAEDPVFAENGHGQIVSDKVDRAMLEVDGKNAVS